MPRLPLVLLSLSLGVCVVVGAGSARCDDKESVSARLSWQRLPGAESCIDASSLEAAINRRWRRRVFVEDKAAELVVEGKVGRGAPDQWSASIEMRRSDGTSLGSREIQTKARDCSALDDSVALALGIMLDMTKQRIAEERALHAEAQSGAGATEAAPVTTSPAAEKPRKAPAAEPIAIPPETSAPRAPWHVEPSISAQGALGVLPGFAFGARAGVGLIPPNLFRFELSGSFFLPHDAPEDQPGARFSAWSADMSAFPLAVLGDSLRFDVGGGIRILGLRVEGVGLAQVGVAKETVIALGPRAGFAWGFAGHFEAVVGGGADVALSQYRFVYRDSGGRPVSVHESSLFSAELYAGLALLL